MKTLVTEAGVGFSVLVFILAVVGCASSKNQVDANRGSNGAKTVFVYDKAELPASAFETIGEVTGAACKEDVYAPSPNREKAVEELKRQAEQRGGSALVNVRCRRGESTDDCPGAYRCVGEAVDVASVESLPRMSQRLRSDEVGTSDEQRGTGWIVSPGRVVTSYELVRDRSEFTLFVADTTVDAELVATDKIHNLAVLRPSRPSVLPSPIPLAQDSMRVGASVFTVGYPGYETGETDLRTATGIISAQSGALGDARVYRTTIPSSFERGGGPLLNWRGQAVGVLVPTSRGQGISQSRASSESISYAVKNEYVRQLLTRLNVRSDSLGTPSEGTGFSREQTSLPSLLERVAPSVLPVTAR